MILHNYPVTISHVFYDSKLLLRIYILLFLTETKRSKFVHLLISWLKRFRCFGEQSVPFVLWQTQVHTFSSGCAWYYSWDSLVPLKWLDLSSNTRQSNYQKYKPASAKQWRACSACISHIVVSFNPYNILNKNNMFLNILYLKVPKDREIHGGFFILSRHCLSW